MKKKGFFRSRASLCLTVGSVLLTLLAAPVYPQMEKTLKFIPADIDFGTIREEDGKATRKVKAVNISPDSTSIVSARTSCGCSSVDYPEAVLAPGDTTEISITYNPLDRPGKFLKTARLFTGEERIGNSVKLHGNVIPSRKNLDQAYPERIGDLRFSSVIVNVGEMSRKEARPLFVGIYNDSDRAIAVTADTDHAALEAALVPDTIEPYGIGSLSLMLKGRLIPENDQEILYKAYLLNTATGDTLGCIPVGGLTRTN